MMFDDVLMMFYGMLISDVLLSVGMTLVQHVVLLTYVS